MAAVSDGYRATAPDLLGFGRSPRPVDARYDVDEHLERLVPLVPPGSVVVAHSTGAVLAAALAARRPDLVRSLLLIGAPLYADVPEARREVRRLGPLARVTASGEVLGRLTMVVLHGLVQPLSHGSRSVFRVPWSKTSGCTAGCPTRARSGASWSSTRPCRTWSS